MSILGQAFGTALGSALGSAVATAADAAGAAAGAAPGPGAEAPGLAPREWAVLAVYGVAAAAVAVYAGVFRRRSVEGPPRVAPREPLGVLLVILLAAFTMWLLLPALLVGRPAPTPSPAPPAGATTTSPAAASDSAGPLAGVPRERLVYAGAASGAAVFLLMVLANRWVRGGLGPIGLALRQLPRGLLTGLVGAFVMIWLVFVTAALTEILWRAIGYRHPKEHELLHMLGQRPDPLLFGVLIASAVLIAPAFEEALFRGHLQTLLTYGLSRLGRGAGAGGLLIPGKPKAFPPKVFPPKLFPAPGPDDTLPGAPAEPVPVLPYAALVEEPAAPPPSAAARWTAITLTSLAFALVHPAWTIPPIFILSLCVGYAYERTGNLWTVITMHAAFNLCSTVLYLTVAGG